MGLLLVEATHVRVVCDGCRSASAELCGKRELAATLRATAVPKLRRAGWHLDVPDHGRSKTADEASRTGAGKWYCPACASKTHL